MDKDLLQHEKNCFGLREKERHDYMDNRVQNELLKMDKGNKDERGIIHKRVDKVKEEIKQIDRDNTTHKANIKEMKETSNRIEGKLDKFIDEIKNNYVSKVEFKPVVKIMWGIGGAVGVFIIKEILSLI